jgi:hypothetical protein
LIILKDLGHVVGIRNGCRLLIEKPYGKKHMDTDKFVGK